MKRIKHWTPLYIWDRTQQFIFEKSHPEYPWLTRDSIRILDDLLKPTDVGIEWGSGRSTIWFARKIKHITSIEDNEQWADHVKRMINDNHLQDKVKLETRLKTDSTPPPSYVDVIDEFKDESLDFCIVDGDLRDQCALRGIQKIRPGGILVLDNIERYLPRTNPSTAPTARNMDAGFASRNWEIFSKIVKNWRYIWTSDGVSDTAIWFKPH